MSVPTKSALSSVPSPILSKTPSDKLLPAPEIVSNVYVFDLIADISLAKAANCPAVKLILKGLKDTEKTFLKSSASPVRALVFAVT